MFRIFSVQFGSVVIIFFIAHIDDYFLVAQICQAHFTKKWELIVSLPKKLWCSVDGNIKPKKCGITRVVNGQVTSLR